jgi:hypothetical protein
MAATADIPAPDGKSRTNTTTNFSTISTISSFSYFFGSYYHSSAVAAVFNTIYTTRVRNLIKFSTHHRAIAS